MKFAGEKLYGKSPISRGALYKKHVFCSDITLLGNKSVTGISNKKVA